MRKIPVIVNNDFEHIIGWLELDDHAINDEMLSDMFVSWQYIPDQKKVIGMTLMPMESVRRTDGSRNTRN